MGTAKPVEQSSAPGWASGRAMGKGANIRKNITPALLLALALALLLVPLFKPTLGVYVIIVAIGVSVALQKYVASFAGYFVLRLSRLFDVGDRIRIGNINIKGDVRYIGLLHFVLDEVGEGEKFGGELTGRILHIPNHIVLDQPVLNFSQDFSVRGRFISCQYMFDELRIPLQSGINLEKARKLLEDIIRQEDSVVLQQAKKVFSKDLPNFLEEAEQSPRIMVFIDAQHTWLVGKFVAPVRGRNDLKSTITTQFLEALEREKNLTPK